MNVIPGAPREFVNLQWTHRVKVGRPHIVCEMLRAWKSGMAVI